MTAMIDRGLSASPIGARSVHHHYYDDSTRVPPWEQRKVAPVPFMVPRSPPLPPTDKHAGSFSRTTGRPTLNTNNSSYQNDDYGDAPISPGEGINRWRNHPAIPAPPLTAPPPPATPYESVKIPQGPKSAPHLPAFVRPSQAPPTPPDSFALSRSSTKSSSHKQGRSQSHETSPIPAPLVTALPGTMSTRERDTTTRSHSHPVLSERNRTHTRIDKPATNKGFGKRFKAAFKDMFKRDPVDENEFERIEDRHWADD